MKRFAFLACLLVGFAIVAPISIKAHGLGVGEMSSKAQDDHQILAKASAASGISLSELEIGLSKGDVVISMNSSGGGVVWYNGHPIYAYANGNVIMTAIEDSHFRTFRGNDSVLKATLTSGNVR